jgi:Flp pilus assembly pilin Flp
MDGWIGDERPWLVIESRKPGGLLTDYILVFVNLQGEGARARIPIQPKTTLKENPTMFNRIKNFLTSESGLELSEYAVGAALIAGAAILAFTALGSNITNVISNLASTIAG